MSIVVCMYDVLHDVIWKKEKRYIMQSILMGHNPPFAVWTLDVLSLPWDTRVNTS